MHHSMGAQSLMSSDVGSWVAVASAQTIDDKAVIEWSVLMCHALVMDCLV